MSEKRYLVKISNFHPRTPTLVNQFEVLTTGKDGITAARHAVSLLKDAQPFAIKGEVYETTEIIELEGEPR